MSLEKVSDILKMADKAKTSAIAYNCTDYNTIYSAITVAEEMNKPVICMLYPEHAQKNNWCNPKSFSETVRSIARNVGCRWACIWITVRIRTISWLP